VPTNFGTPQLPFDTTGVEMADISETESINYRENT
jgi:hypothetical protein